MEFAKIKCNRDVYRLPIGEHEGVNLRAFFGVRNTHDLYLKNVDDAGDDTLVDPKEMHAVKDGNKYYTVHKQIIGG